MNSEHSQTDTSAEISNEPMCLQHGNHDFDYTKPIKITDTECQACKTFYIKYVHLSEDKIDEICNKTE